MCKSWTLAALVFSPVVLLSSPVQNRPVCQTHALYGKREMWASGERCSYFKRTRLPPSFWSALSSLIWTYRVFSSPVTEDVEQNSAMFTTFPQPTSERPSLKLFLNRTGKQLSLTLYSLKGIVSSFTHSHVVPPTCVTFCHSSSTKGRTLQTDSYHLLSFNFFSSINL